MRCMPGNQSKRERSRESPAAKGIGTLEEESLEENRPPGVPMKSRGGRVAPIRFAGIARATASAIRRFPECRRRFAFPEKITVTTVRIIFKLHHRPAVFTCNTVISADFSMNKTWRRAADLDALSPTFRSDLVSRHRRRKLFQPVDAGSRGWASR